MTNIEPILQSWKKNELTPKERVKLLRLLEEEEGQQQFQQFWEGNWQDTEAESLPETEVDERLKAIRYDIKARIQEDKRSRWVRRYRGIGALAAGIAMLWVGGWLFFQSQQTDADRGAQLAIHQLIEVKVERGGRIQRVALPDGSKVWLNVDSKLQYPASFSDSLRKVWVEGEAYFEVTEDRERPFVVAVNKLETRVLGTTFYITSYEGAPTRVTLTSGKVQVQNDKGQHAILSPNYQLISDQSEGLWDTSHIDPAEMGHWREGLLAYDAIPLGELAPMLERWYGVEIRFETARSKKCRIYGSPTNESIVDLLESFREIGRITYKIDEAGVIHISGGNC